MYKHKKFTDLTTGKVVEVTDHFEDIVILDGRSKVKLNKLLDTGLYDEYIDPRNFFKNEGLVSAFTEKIRQIPTESIKNEQEKFDPLNPPVLKNYGDPMRPSFDEPAVLPYDPEEEKKQLMEKARAMMSGRNEKVEKQIDTFRSIIGDDDEEIDINFPIEPETNNNYTQPIPKKESYMQNTVDPIIQMFRNAKRNTEFQISFSINNKIPRVDFIEMMEDSYNTSIIDFLAEEFTNEILLNPEILKNRIKEQISTKVYGTDKSEQKVESPKTVVRKKTIKTND
jgi:hypothetical protein